MKKSISAHHGSVLPQTCTSYLPIATSTLIGDFFAQKIYGSGLPRRNRQPSTKSFVVVTTDGRNTGLIIMLNVSNVHVKLAMMNIDEYQ